MKSELERVRFFDLKFFQFDLEYFWPKFSCYINFICSRVTGNSIQNINMFGSFVAINTPIFITRMSIACDKCFALDFQRWLISTLDMVGVVHLDSEARNHGVMSRNDCEMGPPASALQQAW